MRITDGMMRNNSLLNINRNKQMLSRLEQQMSTGKKIQKPSEDPIVAVKAIKLRSTVREIEQYQKNIGDALSWMSVTEEAMMNVNDVLKRVRDLSVQGSNDTLGTDERAKVVEELEQLKIQILQEGNVNYAGRFVFTGYKTNKSLIFNQDNDERYAITQELSGADIEQITYIDAGDPTADPIVAPSQQTAHRIRLAYEGLDGDELDGDILSNELDGIDDVEILDSSDENAYNPPQGTVHFLADTGELIFHEEDVNAIEDFSITYEKQGFQKHDLNPEHYFDAIHKVEDDPDTWIHYEKKDEDINYQVSYNQDIDVNIQGRDLITHDMIRDIDELVQKVRNIPSAAEIEEKVKEVPEDQQEEYREMLMLEKDLLETQLGKNFEQMLTKCDKHLNSVIGKTAELGSRMNRLELTFNRLDADGINFKDLMSENEDVDIAEVVVNMTSAELVYQASLMASARTMQSTLLDFIR
ncbi:flagellar hook-associated protein 3 FlgL [Natranaerovirga hydrolytica]|uniref:Flagellar hook-associated protein 3 FlgL n=1 Tax=Natranaerovirga hydrolytica TaxID=680378 RepID=A0A4R1MMN5_9FIRM|nr:flagellar hook-associated protein FlgL [Natranaerovirga hydrolytica]TCK93380.1 flagellar hook-associated protein 3 FlgL [Natranaerovirga hydrolytica]